MVAEFLQLSDEIRTNLSSEICILDFSKKILKNVEKCRTLPGELGCSEQAVTICAMMQIENVFTTPANEKIAADRAKRKFSVTEGDHLTMYNVYKAFVQVRLESLLARPVLDNFQCEIT